MSRYIPGEAEARWRAHLERWKSSGLSLRDFSEEEKLNFNSLWAWKRRLLGTTPRPAPKLVPLVVVPKASASKVTTPKVTKPASKAVFELLLRSGHTLRVPSDFDHATLHRLIDALGGG